MDRDAAIAPAAWAELRFLAAPWCVSCGVPFDYSDDMTSGLRCAGCLTFPPHYDSARAALAYNDGSRKLILSFKHGDQQGCASLMAGLMIRLIESAEQYDALIPVPLHYRKLITRRFNQSALLAREISHKTGIPLRPDGLNRIRHTPPQKDKNNKERRQNVKRAFAVPDKYLNICKDGRFIVVDDVYTTGATANECAYALKKAGAGRVDILTFARTVRE